MQVAGKLGTCLCTQVMAYLCHVGKVLLKANIESSHLASFLFLIQMYCRDYKLVFKNYTS